jgi:hypothetical protein
MDRCFFCQRPAAARDGGVSFEADVEAPCRLVALSARRSAARLAQRERVCACATCQLERPPSPGCQCATCLYNRPPSPTCACATCQIDRGLKRKR